MINELGINNPNKNEYCKEFMLKLFPNGARQGPIDNYKEILNSNVKFQNHIKSLGKEGLKVQFSDGVYIISVDGRGNLDMIEEEPNNMNEIKRMQQLAGIQINELQVNNPTVFYSEHELAYFLNRCKDEVIKLIPELKDIPGLDFEVLDDGFDIPVVIPTTTDPNQNAADMGAPITFNIYETGGEEWGSDKLATIKGKKFYWGWYNY